MRSRTVGIFLFLAPAFCAGAKAQNTTLFNGKDLSQWEAAGKAEWRVEDGVIVGGQDGDPKRSGILISKGDYKDFDLRLEYNIDEHGKYNSGIYFRRPRTKRLCQLAAHPVPGVAFLTNTDAQRPLSAHDLHRTFPGSRPSRPQGR